MPRAEPSTNETLLLAVCAQPMDAESWERFVFLYGPLVIDWARRYGLQDADARDVAQDVLMQFLNRAETFRYDRSRKFRGYLRTITHATWCDWVEKRHAEGRRMDVIAETGPLEQPSAYDDLVSSLEGEYDRELLALAMKQVSRQVEPKTWEVLPTPCHRGIIGQGGGATGRHETRYGVRGPQ